MKTIVTLLVALFALAPPTHAALNLKPGLWEITTKFEGQDPMAQMKASLAKMKPEQRKQIEAMMAKQGMSVGNGGIKVCFTADQLKDVQALIQAAQKSNCKTTMKEQTPKRMAMDFTCEDGAKGIGVWNLVNDQRFTSEMKITTKDNKTSTIDSTGVYASKDCGNVKPILQPKK